MPMPEPKKNKRIAMLGTAYDTKGGISSVVNVYREAGLFERWPIEYIATHRDGSKLQKILQAAKAVGRLSWLIVSRRLSLIHVHMASGPSFWRKSIYFLLARLAKVPFIVHLHGGEFDQFYAAAGPLTRWAVRKIFRWSAEVVALSDEWKTWITRETGVDRISVIFNPVTIPPATPDSLRQPRTLLFLGQFGQRKGIYVLLPAIAKLVKHFPDLELWAGGDGELDTVAKMAKSLSIENQVKLLGWVGGEEKEKLLARASIYVLPSYAENLPMSVLEAMAAGLPIVSTPVGGIPSAVHDGIEGRLVQPGDVDLLATALGDLLNDSAMRQTMGHTARRSAIDKFSASNVVVSLGALYRRLGIQAPPRSGDDLTIKTELTSKGARAT